MEKYIQLEKLDKLKKDGVLTEEEFLSEKQKVLTGSKQPNVINAQPLPIPKKTNWAAIIGFIISLIGGFTWGLSLVMGLIGLVLSIIGLEKSSKEYGNRGLAVAGLILSLIIIIVGFIWILYNTEFGREWGVGKNSLKGIGPTSIDK